MPNGLYPNIHDAASDASDEAQKAYLRLIIAEYTLLTIASVVSLNFFKTSEYHMLSGFILIAAVAVLSYRTAQKPEQTWYQCRALAESVKTSTWRFMMSAPPFNSENKAEARTSFLRHLNSILELNKQIGPAIASRAADADQITQEMLEVRSKIFVDRRKYYLERRIRDQRSWYTMKASRARANSKICFRVCCIVYSFAILLAFVRVKFPVFEFWPIDPLIVVASSLIGWMQIKKYNELASAYTLTAHEIGLVEHEIKEASFQEFPERINEAELVFSREHTQWTARQDNR